MSFGKSCKISKAIGKICNQKFVLKSLGADNICGNIFFAKEYFLKINWKPKATCSQMNLLNGEEHVCCDFLDL